MGLLTGKKALVLGVANEKSIAWGITRALKAQGASVALTYVNDQIKKRVGPLAEDCGADFIHQVDVTVDEHYTSLKEKVEKERQEMLAKIAMWDAAEKLPGLLSVRPPP